MADKGKGGTKPVPMKLFATWEVDKSSPNCIPRLCSLTLTRLVVEKPLENDLQSIIIAVRMQNSKRLLRSNEITMPTNGVLDTELDLAFSLQYLHFMKRDGGKLQVLLQRRKRYKNRAILGYKTFAIGQVNMSEVLQRSVDKDLYLYTDLKEMINPVGYVTMLSLCSQPVDHDDNGVRKVAEGETEMSDEEEMGEEEEETSNEDASENEGTDDRPTRTVRKFGRKTSRPLARMQQRNIKEKFISLLKKFRASEEGLDSEHDRDAEANAQDIDELIDEMEGLSESEPEMDNLSVRSTPKPKLKPFFSGKGSNDSALNVVKEAVRNASDDSTKLNESDACVETDEAGETTTAITDNLSPQLNCKSSEEKAEKSIMRDKKGKSKGKIATEGRNNSSNNADPSPAINETQKQLLDQLALALGTGDDILPENLILLNVCDWQGQVLSHVLQEPLHRIIPVSSSNDVKDVMTFLVNKFQKFCNSNSRAPNCIKLAIIGGDSFVNTVLRPYVELFSNKAPDWQQFIRFIIIPLGSTMVGRHLALIDPKFGSLFNDQLWRDTFDKVDNSSSSELGEVVRRILHYLTTASCVIQLPIAEAMLTYRDKSAGADSHQVFVPFVVDVRVGPLEGSYNTAISVDLDDSLPLTILSSSPPQSSFMDRARELSLPSSSGSVIPQGQQQSSSSGSMSPVSSVSPDLMDLQLDYWLVPSKQDLIEVSKSGDKISSKKDIKNSLKMSFRSIQLYRLPSHSVDPSTLSMTIITKEKKQKIMRLGKKSKDSEAKSQTVDGVSRLICTATTKTQLLTVTIDGIEWNNVKFFQLSPQWQTHIKQFPIVLFGHGDSN